jgi:dTMP kinase
MTAKLIILEGPDGAGKSAAASNLQKYIQQQYDEKKIDSKAVVLRDPGFTDVGEELRKILLDPDKKACPDTIFFGFLAARAELLCYAQRQLAEFGNTVIMDRLWPSTLAYQGYGMGISTKLILDTASYLLEKYIPLNVRIHYCFLTASRAIRQARLRAAGDRGKDRFESKPSEFFDRLDLGYERAEIMAADLSAHGTTMHHLDVTTSIQDQVVLDIMAGLPNLWTTGYGIKA